jgi:predicted nucleotidyltransferase
VEDEKAVAALAEYRNGLRELYGERLERVMLFGSRARGDARPGSDADVLVVLRGKFNYDKEIERTSKMTAEVSLKHGIRISRGFMNKSKADSPDGSLQANIRMEGVVL